MQQKITAARMSAAPTSEPMTMPAMAPPESPDRERLPLEAAPVEPGPAEAVLDGKRGGIETVVGSVTPWQRDSTFEVTQHESVELTLLV